MTRKRRGLVSPTDAQTRGFRRCRHRLRPRHELAGWRRASEQIVSAGVGVQSAGMRRIAIVCAVATLVITAVAAPAQPPLKAGEEFEIVKSYETSETRSDGGSSSSHGHDTLLERVIALRRDGVELEYDLSKDSTAEDRAREWKFPARVLKPANGPARLLNRSELEARLDKWLKAANWTHEICGHWIFTWDAFQIDCDPDSVIPIVESYDVTSADLRDGVPYRTKEAREPGTLVRKSAGESEIYTAVMEIDPDAVRRARAETDVAVGEIMQKPVALEAALRERSKESVSGTVTVTFETGSAGRVHRSIKVTRIESKSPSGVSETQTATETIERTLVSR